MANIKVEMLVRLYDRKEAEKICAFFSGVKVSWTFCQKESIFTAKTTIKEFYWNNYQHEIIDIQKLIAMLPDNEKLKENLVCCEERAKRDKIYDVTVSFKGEIAAEIDIDYNSILHYTGPILDDIAYRDMRRLKKMIKSDYLDEFYHDYIKRFISCIIMASIFANPSVRLGFKVSTWFDGVKYKSDSFIKNSLHTDAYQQYASLMTTSLKYTDAFVWIKKYAVLQEATSKPPVPFAMLTYLFNRDIHESLLYSVIGLENLYSAKGGEIAKKLCKRISYIFPEITEQQVEGIYMRRSDFVHGKIEMPPYKDYSDLRNDDIYFDDAAILACALLLETIRKMAANDASKILFDVYCSYRFA